MAIRVKRETLALTLLLLYVIMPSSAGAQTTTVPTLGPPAATPGEVAEILGINPRLQKLVNMQAQRTAGAPMSLEELTLRQEILESIQASLLDVDSALAELSNEQSELGSLRTALQARRDKKVGRLTTAALLTGSGVGTAVSATQFTTLSSTTQNVGDALGIASGAASTILSVLAARAQNGPSGSVESTPNMLAPLLGGTPVLSTYYPPEVLEFLRSVPAGEDPAQSTRLARLLAEWDRVGRLSAADSPQRDQKIAALTTSDNPKVKVTIDDLTDRIAMLGDVRSKVSLMQRDLAALMHAYMTAPRQQQ